MFNVGQIYNRREEIHGPYGGQDQGGISTPKKEPIIFIFTGDSGSQYGYKDGWDDNGVFVYTGEGQIGDMEFVRGNKAIRDHVQDGKDLHLFENLGKGKGYRYLGQFFCSSWEYRDGVDKEGSTRKVIVFHLLSSEEVQSGDIQSHPPTTSLEELRKKAYQAASPAIQSSSSGAKNTYYQRSQDVKNYVLARANGICESCGEPAPFQRRNKNPYLEPHHTHRLSDGGPDHPRWVGAICPNCHREVHHGIEGPTKNKRLIEYLEKHEGS